MSTVPQNTVRRRIASLQEELAQLVTLPEQMASVSSGCSAVDQLLPGGGLRGGMLVECLTPGLGSGAATVALQLAKQMLQAERGALVVTDRWRRFYPPALLGLGVPLSELIVVRSGAKHFSAAEELWALDQALRSRGVSAVLAWMGRIDPRGFRRLQLAAEQGGTLGIFVRPERVQAEPTWSDVQWLVTPCPQPQTPQPQLGNPVRHCELRLLRQRGRLGGGALEGQTVAIAVDDKGLTAIPPQGETRKPVREGDETGSLHRAPKLAHSTSRRRSARA